MTSVTKDESGSLDRVEFEHGLDAVNRGSRDTTFILEAYEIMGMFFQGWRRKLGVAMLVLACLFMGGWARSLSMHDALTIYAQRTISVDLVSMNEFLLILTGFQEYSQQPSRKLPDWRHREIVDPIEKTLDGVTWHWRFCGFGYGTEHVGFQQSILIFPYWSIVVPLTALSAFLLLSTPRKSKTKNITEPISAREA